MLNFSSLPKDKPNQNAVSEGRYDAVVFDAKMVDSKTTPGTQYLNVSFKLNEGGFVNENYFESDKPFLMYKLGRLLKACGVNLEGEGSLKDVAKVVKGKKVTIDVVVNDKGYGSLDYSGNNEGIYPYGQVFEEYSTTETIELQPEIANAIEADVDDDF